MKKIILGHIFSVLLAGVTYCQADLKIIEHEPLDCKERIVDKKIDSVIFHYNCDPEKITLNFSTHKYDTIRKCIIEPEVYFTIFYDNKLHANYEAIKVKSYCTEFAGLIKNNKKFGVWTGEDPTFSRYSYGGEGVYYSTEKFYYYDYFIIEKEKIENLIYLTNEDKFSFSLLHNYGIGEIKFNIEGVADNKNIMLCTLKTVDNKFSKTVSISELEYELTLLENGAYDFELRKIYAR